MMSDWVFNVVDRRSREHMADSDPWMSPPPGLRSPATPEQLIELEGWMGQPLDADYAEFLLQSDGMEHFYLNMPVLGWQDWAGGEPPQGAREFRDMMQGEFCVDAGLAPDVALAPVSVNEDASRAIFMIPAETGKGRFLWTGEGDQMFFPTFRELFECAAGTRDWGDYCAP
ncbi:SMI1/KNR4 family protein [Kitasatospora sp. MMS16-BH015]|uniref:SMI1/KNR4 family protein n=1 Tax=Kitasatospora sp. MMS16-BH015 TaxID=2018025 RepID=UPI000CF25B7D|nr:SMI1/KNR4 family protein [Kitasatospora sp. MMS16-BH015]